MSDTAIQDGANALRTVRQPWYDADTDSLALRAAADQGDAPIRARWANPLDLNLNWNWDLSWMEYVAQAIVWGVVALLLGLLLYGLILAYREFRAQVPGLGPLDGDEGEAVQQSRIEQLPMAVPVPARDLFAAARTCYEQQDFRKAIILLFGHRLLQLDKAGFLTLSKGKTNRQYLTELQSARALQLILGRSTVVFEQAFFSEHQISRQQFEQCWNENDSFGKLLMQRPA